MAMSERWFIALWPDAATREALVEQARRTLPPLAKPTHPQDLHLTLVFLGELSPERRRCVERVLDQTQSPAIALELDCMGHFARSRVLWCGPSRPPGALLDLVAGLRARLTECGLAPETRPYRAHLTLARHSPAASLRPMTPGIDWIATELALAHGVDGARPRYLVRRRWTLGGR